MEDRTDFITRTTEDDSHSNEIKTLDLLEFCSITFRSTNLRKGMIQRILKRLKSSQKKWTYSTMLGRMTRS